ncbi:HEAT repeat domain-containing protein [Priestia abyssalis]|uniref:HEAT repeat domain-containing protein n=1 Tax=Priestia abyssalis TaxID=1221450 RepID=UPI000994EC4F|nr:HEAT repeat domain-containing protein [Priestia abyssalis]
MKNEMIFLMSLTILLVTLLFLLLGYLIIRKVLIGQKERRIAEIMKNKQQVLFIYLQNGKWSKKLIPATTLERMALEKLLINFLDLFKGEEVKARMTEYITSYFLSYYKKQLFHRNGSIRLNTLYRILDFRISQLNDDIVFLVEKGIEDREIFLICNILAHSQDPRVLPIILHYVRSLTVYELRAILQELEICYFQEIVSHYNELEERYRFAVLETIGFEKRLDYLPLLEQVARGQEGEERIRALKAISFLGYISDVSILHETALSSRWEERLMTAKIIGSLCTEREIPLLYRLIEDRVWRVRYEAGHSLYKYKQAKQLLREFAEKTEDRYAKDMALEWLERIS